MLFNNRISQQLFSHSLSEKPPKLLMQLSILSLHSKLMASRGLKESSVCLSITLCYLLSQVLCMFALIPHCHF